MQNNPTIAIAAQGRKASHHQIGVGASTMTDTFSVIQLRERLFPTSGGRWSSRGVSREAAVSAILLVRCRLRPGFFAVTVVRLHRRSDLFRAGHLHVGVADSRQVPDARVDVEVFEEPIAALVLAQFGNRTLL